MKNMNPQIAKHGRWILRVLDPKMTEYTFKDKRKGEIVHAKKLSCLLVSASATHFMLGTVNFSFARRAAADEAFKKFTHGSVWEVRDPHLDPKASAYYNSCPVKAVLVLDAPTKLKAVTFVQTDIEQYPSRNVVVNESVERVCEMVLKGAKGGHAPHSQEDQGHGASRVLVNMWENDFENKSQKRLPRSPKPAGGDHRGGRCKRRWC